MSARRGEVWLVRLESVSQSVGHEQAGKRPALVLSIDQVNANGAELVTVLPITSTPRPLPSRIEVRPPEGGLNNVSYIIGEQPRTISTQRLERRLGMVSSTTMSKAADIVRIVLGL